ncbi:hypothetical protein GCM10007079_11940 [Nocardiopsis terrae]|nr:hypothetical protein GCM10007079_11940 [Nocardiopsis terrae]
MGRGVERSPRRGSQRGYARVKGPSGGRGRTRPYPASPARTLILRSPPTTTSLEDTDARSRIATAERPLIVR